MHYMSTKKESQAHAKCFQVVSQHLGDAVEEEIAGGEDHLGG
jgi:hypothetical protein